MQDYEPLDLSAHWNVGATFAGPSIDPPLGKQSFRGLPFQIGGDNGSDCFIGFTGNKDTDQPVEVAVGKSAHTIVFAHTLLETRIFEGENIGHVVADYVVRLADGTEHRIPVRERFEIVHIPVGWGMHAFLAQPDTIDFNMPRLEGSYNESGRRQSEAIQGNPRAYALFAWRNPSTDHVIRTIRLEPGDRRFLVAGITLGHVDEDPVRHFPKREVKITLPCAKDAEKPFNLEVEVDRGTATYPHAVPRPEEMDAFMEDGFKGWGQKQNDRSSPAYTEIAARPSAEVTIKNHGEVLGRAKWGELQEKGKVESERMQLEVVDRGRNWVHVRVEDEETGRPVACRVHFRSPDGIPYQPHGYHNQVNRNLDSWHQDIGGDLRLGQTSYAYINGSCQGWLPRGEIIVDAARGFEYDPLRARMKIEPGQRELTLKLKRWAHMNEERWFSGDSHVHFLGTQGAHLEAQGEDLNVVNLLQSQWGHLFTNTEDWIGRPTFSDDGKTIVYCSQENRQHLLGHLSLLGLKEPVMPWCSDGPSEAELGGSLEITMSRWADACHAQGGTVIIPHLPNPNGEPATLIATGRADAVEMLIQAEYNHIEYYRYLNCGYQLPLVGGTDKMSSDVAVGMYRTYAFIPENEEFNYDTWCKAVRDGRTFLSGGPMIRLSVDGARIGDTVNLPGNGGTVEVHAEAESIFPLSTLQIMKNGRVVASTDSAKSSRKLQLKESIEVDAHSWIAARCGGAPYFGDNKHHDAWQRGAFAHTSPVYVAVGGDWWMFDKEAAQYMLTLIDGSLEHIRNSAAHYKPGTVTHHHHHHDHQEFLEEPFHEAAAALHKRMHQLGIPH
jgi:hypothetical protein